MVEWKLLSANECKYKLLCYCTYSKIHSAFDNHSTNDTLSIPERRMAFRASTGRELPKELLMADTDSITFDQYCMINAEYRMMVKPNLLKVLGISWPSERYLPQYREPEKVFIGGPTGAKDWRTTVALPHFKLVLFYSVIFWSDKNMCTWIIKVGSANVGQFWLYYAYILAPSGINQNA